MWMPMRTSMTNLIGAIPPTFRNLTSLAVLRLVRKQFLGNIPNEKGHLRNLQQLQLLENFLDGKPPSSIVNLSMHLQELCIGYNFLTGSIPRGLSNLKIPRPWTYSRMTLQALNGSLPIKVGSLENQGTLDASDNQLSRSMPAIIGGHLSLHDLNVARNKLGGLITNSVGKLLALERLDLSSNSLSGPIPEDLERILEHLQEYSEPLLFSSFPITSSGSPDVEATVDLSSP
ncbi:unnamed protein product, partial [Vitis vinifera]